MSVTRPQHLPCVWPVGAVMLQEDCEWCLQDDNVCDMPSVWPVGAVMLQEDCE